MLSSNKKHDPSQGNYWESLGSIWGEVWWLTLLVQGRNPSSRNFMTSYLLRNVGLHLTTLQKGLQKPTAGCFTCFTVTIYYASIPEPQAKAWHADMDSGELYHARHDSDRTEMIWKYSKNDVFEKEHMSLIRGGYIFGEKILIVLCMEMTSIFTNKKTELSQKVIPKTDRFWTCGVLKHWFVYMFLCDLKNYNWQLSHTFTISVSSNLFGGHWSW